MAGAALNLPLSAQPPFVGRRKETALLNEALRQAVASQGSAWVVSGPGGIGKTRLLRWIEDSSKTLGVRVHWGYALKESLTPFFPFLQLFQGMTSAPAAAVPPTGELPPVAIFEEERPKDVFETAARLSLAIPTLVLSRDRPSTLRTKVPGLSAGATVLWLSRSEGPEVVSPGGIDALAERLEGFLREHPGGAVVLSALEYLTSQTSFLPVLRLVQFLRDVAEGTEGHLLLSLNPAAFEPRQLSLLEAEGEISKPGGSAAPPPASSPTESAALANEPPSLTLLRFLETLQRESARAPRLLILDDLQWADPASRLAFQFLARNTRHLPVLMIAAMRDEESMTPPMAGETSLSEVLESLHREGSAHRLTLTGLETDEATGLLEGMLGVPLADPHADPALQNFLERTEGNPYFLQESLHQLLDEGMVQNQDGRAVLRLGSGEASNEGPAAAGRRLPSTVRRLVVRRLETFPVETRQLLEVAALTGSEFDLEPVAAVLGRTPDSLRTTLRELEDRHHLLQEAKGAPDRWRFAHPVVWEVSVGELEPSRRRELATMLATWWAAQRPEDVENVARLFYVAKAKEAALPWIRRATDRALAQSAPEVVERYSRWALELASHTPAEREARARELLSIADHLLETGGRGSPVAVALLNETKDWDLPRPLRWEVDRLRVTDVWGSDRASTLRELARLDQEIAAHPEEASLELRAGLGVQRLLLALNQGQWAEGLALADRLAPLMTEEVRAARRVNYHAARGWFLKELDRLDEASEALATARTLAEKAGVAHQVPKVVNTEAAVAVVRCRFTEAADLFLKASDGAFALGQTIDSAVYRANAALSLAEIEELDRASTLLDEARTLAEKFHSAAALGFIAQCRGEVKIRQGLWGEARTEIQAALTAARAAARENLVAEDRLDLAWIDLETGRPESALRELEDLRAAIAQGDLGIRTRHLHLIGRAQERAGHPEAAREAYLAALAYSREHRWAVSELRILADLARLAEKQGDVAAYRTHRAEATAVAERAGLPPGLTLDPRGPSAAARPGTP